MKLKDALDQYLQIDRAEATRRTYAQFFVRISAYLGPDRPLDHIQAADLTALVDTMRHQTTKYADHPTRPAEPAPLAPATLYKNVKMLKAFFNWCVRRGLLTESPAGHLVNRRPQRPIGIGKAASDNDLEQILAAALFKPRDRAIVLLLAESGCRAGEAARLRIPTLDLDNCSALVHGKGDAWRRIYFGADTTAAIQA